MDWYVAFLNLSVLCYDKSYVCYMVMILPFGYVTNFIIGSFKNMVKS